MEEMVFEGASWHKSCFRCGGTAGNGCNRTLNRDNYVDHDHQPYCNNCYTKLYKPKGFGVGGMVTEAGCGAGAGTGSGKFDEEKPPVPVVDSEPERTREVPPALPSVPPPPAPATLSSATVDSTHIPSFTTNVGVSKRPSMGGSMGLVAAMQGGNATTSWVPPSNVASADINPNEFQKLSVEAANDVVIPSKLATSKLFDAVKEDVHHVNNNSTPASAGNAGTSTTAHKPATAGSANATVGRRPSATVEASDLHKQSTFKGAGDEVGESEW